MEFRIYFRDQAVMLVPCEFVKFPLHKISHSKYNQETEIRFPNLCFAFFYYYCIPELWALIVSIAEMKWLITIQLFFHFPRAHST